MGVKSKWVALACMILLFGLFAVSMGSSDVGSAQETIKTTVTYDYYAVAGYQMVPTPPDPALVDIDPLGFNFTVDPLVFNFGDVSYWGGRNYLYDGFSYSPYTNMTRFGPPMAGAILNISNLGDSEVTILNLTAEVTDGTISKDFFFTPAVQWWGNTTLVAVDTLDVGDYDECDYTTGMVETHRLSQNDPDRYNKVKPELPPELWDDYALGRFGQGSGSLLRNDNGGDALATGHVAPIALASGSTFTEYFGVIILGEVDAGTQINGTIRFALTYEFIPPPEAPKPSFTYTPGNPLIDGTVTFDASNSTPNGGEITSYEWNFGDGSTGSGMIINHTYTTLGTYTVVLNVTDTQGEWLTTSDDVTISEVPSADDELPWLWIIVAIVVIIVVVAVAVFLLKRRK